MFQRLARPTPAAEISFVFDGRQLRGLEGDTVAAALIAAGVEDVRVTPLKATKRGPFCMMGVCFECLVVIDGVGNQQACLVPLKAGMAVERQVGKRDIAR